MKTSIVTKINLLFIVTIVLLGSMIGYYSIRQQIKGLRAEMNERMDVLANSLAASCEYPALIGDIDTIERLVSRTFSQKDVIVCWIEDKQGAVIYKQGNPQSGNSQIYRVPIMVARQEKGTLETMIDDPGSMIKEDIEGTESEVIGSVVITASLERLQEKIANVAKAVVFFMLLVIVMAVIASSLLLNLILTQPLAFLMQGTEKVAQGDLEYKVIVTTDDEIGQFAESFNQMTSDLQRITVSMDYVDNIINSMSDMLVVTNTDGTIRTINQSLASALLYTDADVVDKPVRVLFDDAAEVLSATQQECMLKGEKIQEYEAVARAKDATVIPVNVLLSVMRDRKGAVVGFIVIVRDMREIIKLKRQLFQTEKMAAVGQLAGGVAHEINNPMSVILGFSQTVARRITDEKDPLFLPLKSIEREAMRCKKLVGDLLTFSRVSKTDREPVLLTQLIDETLSLIESKCKVKNIELIREISITSSTISANKNQIQQVLVNLCNNAIDAMDNGGTLSVGVSPADKEGYVTMWVKDTGSGIPADIKERIFEPFFTTKEVGKGTGLGLSISYEIVQKHSGKISVDSSQDTGTIFHVKLPVKNEGA